ncbi:uncharacterized protein VTP21DRAFT_4534 [Calcarisporiella thermophila]|uniref:uncharacterized protein n=1 Tax=Calcarisporiella thermophila TaxID=911321 RepID=UPI0037449EA8
MGGYYIIAGRKVANHWLALGTIGTFGGLTYLATRGSKSKPAPRPEPPASKDEDEIIREFMKLAEEEEKK